MIRRFLDRDVFLRRRIYGGHWTIPTWHPIYLVPLLWLRGYRRPSQQWLDTELERAWIAEGIKAQARAERVRGRR